MQPAPPLKLHWRCLSPALLSKLLADPSVLVICVKVATGVRGLLTRRPGNYNLCQTRWRTRETPKVPKLARSIYASNCAMVKFDGLDVVACPLTFIYLVLISKMDPQFLPCVKPSLPHAHSYTWIETAMHRTVEVAEVKLHSCCLH